MTRTGVNDVNDEKVHRLLGARVCDQLGDCDRRAWAAGFHDNAAYAAPILAAMIRPSIAALDLRLRV
jgi:hypothetical protein